jgi:epoxyqueuosine reductase
VASVLCSAKVSSATAQVRVPAETWPLRAFRRLHKWATYTPVVDWILTPGVQHFYSSLPSLPRFISTRLGTEPPRGPRSLDIPDLPENLKTAPGVPRDRRLELESFNNVGPLQYWPKVHHEAIRYLRRQQWLLNLVTYQKRARVDALLEKTPARKAGIERADVDPVDLTRRMKARAAEIGLSAVGVTKYDPMVMFEPDVGQSFGDRVIICVVEQNWAAVQSIPSMRGERSHRDAGERSQELANELADFLRALGYTARASDSLGINIAYGVEAGLGQLGLNGQLLTPFAGSRTRLAIVVTDAPLALDSPVDYGIPAICDACKSCVRNCPSSAIRSTRAMHRGVYKAKIKTERCMPILAQVHGCAICIKVCPVQRYGLPAVIEEFKRSGKVLGTNTDELEGYVWPIDGRYYGPGQRPPSAVSPAMLKPPGFVLDPKRRLPVLNTEPTDTDRLGEMM